MSLDHQLFRDVLSRWATGVTVVSCTDPTGVHHGMTASAFCSVSLEPPLVLVCIDRRHKTHRFIEERRRFGIHILSAGMEEVSDRCAGFRGEAGHDISDLIDSEAPEGFVLCGALGWLHCSLWSAYDGGDHSIYVGEVEAAGARGGTPLLWYERGYHLLDVNGS